MNTKLKKITMTLALMLCFVFGFTALTPKADADVSIGLSSGNASIGDEVTATVYVSGGDISAYTIYVSYSSDVLQFNSAGGSAICNGGGGTLTISGTGESSVTISFTAIGNGTASISTSGSECYDINLNTLGISHAGASVEVYTDTPEEPTTEKQSDDDNDDDEKDDDDKKTEEDGKSSDASLASLEISPGTLEPAFSPSTTSYFVQVDEDVTSMVVSATPASDKAITDVSGAGLIEPGENTVTITVTAENGAVRVYNLRVVAGVDNDSAVAQIGGKIYSFVNRADELEVPEGYLESKLKYKDWEVLSFTSPNKKLNIVCLKSEDDKYFWYIYDKDTDKFYPYHEISAEFARYVVLPIPKDVTIPESFEESSFKLAGTEAPTFQSKLIEDKDIYLVYAMNVEGEGGLYFYDAKEKSLMRYAIPVKEPEQVVAEATPSDVPVEKEVVIKEVPMQETGFFTKKNITLLLYIASGVAVLLMMACIASLVRNSKLRRELRDAEDMISHLASDKKAVDSSLYDNENGNDDGGDSSDKKDKKDKKKSKNKGDKKDALETETSEQDTPENNDTKSEVTKPADIGDKIQTIPLPDDVEEFDDDSEEPGEFKKPDDYDPDKDSAF
ncbi:MAG: cadherin-like beta sandwich domain-containing protein [Lachnospiraceae bacterium]|nr:cadherin-like beta sandwich domain-containing protein [Lachnospiraceae bacterium]